MSYDPFRSSYLSTSTMNASAPYFSRWVRAPHDGEWLTMEDSIASLLTLLVSTAPSWNER